MIIPRLKAPQFNSIGLITLPHYSQNRNIKSLHVGHRCELPGNYQFIIWVEIFYQKTKIISRVLLNTDIFKYYASIHKYTSLETIHCGSDGK